jgi:IclR family acetate operon transcriptional repressor
MSKTVRKAFGLLEALSRESVARRVSDLAQEAGMTESSACRLLATLVELGYAAREERSGLYAPTLKLWSVAHTLISRTDELHTIAQPILDALSEKTGESAALGVFDDGYAVYVAKSDGAGAIRAVATVGARLPAMATGFGKAIVAWRPELLDAALGRAERFTERTLMTREQMERDLEAARERGFAITQGELFPDTCAIGYPIFDGFGKAVAGVALWGAQAAILAERKAWLAQHVREAAQAISAHLGYVEKPAARAARSDARGPLAHSTNAVRRN